MSAETQHDPLNNHEGYATELVTLLMSGITTANALTICDKITEEDFAGYWQPNIVFKAIRMVAQTKYDNNQPNAVVTPTDVHHYLLNSGALKNNSFREYWINFQAPHFAPFPHNVQSANTLATRLIESHFRIRHSDLFATGDSFTAPVTELISGMENSVKELSGIAKRITEIGNQLSVVKGGAA